MAGLARTFVPWQWALAGLCCDLMVGTSLILLLVGRTPEVPAPLRRWIRLDGHRLRKLLLSVTVISYLTLAPIFLYLLMHQVRIG